MTDPAYDKGGIKVLLGNSLAVLAELDDESVHAVVTDPPYGLSNTTPPKTVEAVTRWVTDDRAYVPDGAGFMGKAWDSFVPPPALWDECMRVLKPGGHLLAFAGSRTVDLMTLGLRISGFDVRDALAWVYGSGFPKSLNVALAIDRAADNEGEWVREDHPSRKGTRTNPGAILGQGNHMREDNPEGLRHVYRANEDGAAWEGWGTALKPAYEPIVVARKPMPGTVAANVLQHGTGALNVGALRVGDEARFNAPAGNDGKSAASLAPVNVSGYEGQSVEGRWPANVIVGHNPDCQDDGPCSDGCQVRVLDQQSHKTGAVDYFADVRYDPIDEVVARFYYTAKAKATERVAVGGVMHPTVKPLALMRWLVRLVTPPDGVVLDPFGGSGTTAEAALLEGVQCVTIEREADYLPLIEQRLDRRRDPAAAIRRAAKPGDEDDLFGLLA